MRYEDYPWYDTISKGAVCVEGFIGLINDGRDIAIATTQPDMGEGEKAKSLDFLKKIVEKAGLKGARVAAFPCKGHIYYVITPPRQDLREGICELP